MTGEAIYRRLADLVTAKAGNNKIIKGTQSDRPGGGLVQGFSASGPDVWVTSADYNRPGVILSAVGARCGKTFLAEDSWTSIANTHVLLPSPSVDHRWLWYLTNDESFWVRGGSAQPFVKVKDTLQKEVMVPSLPEQQRIVTILDEAFDSLATAKTNAEKNLQNARAIFESHLQSVFTQRGKGWTDRTLGEIAVFRNGINFTKSSTGEPIKILGVKDFRSSYWAPLEDLETVIPDGALGDLDMLQKNDLVFVRSNGNPELIGRCLLVGEVTEKTTHSGFTIRARLSGSELSSMYLCHFLKSNLVRREMIDGGNGSNIRSLNQGTLSRLEIPVPPTSEQVQIVSQLEDVDGETKHLESIYQQKLTALDELKKSLLHRAFTGDL